VSVRPADDIFYVSFFLCLSTSIRSTFLVLVVIVLCHFCANNIIVFSSCVKQRLFKACELKNVAMLSVTVTVCQYIKEAELDTEHCSIIAVMLLLFPVCLGFFYTLKFSRQ